MELNDTATFREEPGPRIIAALLLVVLAPLFACVAIAIKLDDRGDVFFRQERVGLGGRSFRSKRAVFVIDA